MGCGSSAASAAREADARLSLQLPGRPEGAVGTFLRCITVNDVYKLDNYPRVATAVNLARARASDLDCVVTSHINGDFLSPCILSALDGGCAMAQGLNYAKIEYLCLGNHEFDMSLVQLKRNLKLFEGKVINSNVLEAAVSCHPKFDVRQVGSRKVVIAGACTGNETIYTPPVPAVGDVDTSLVAAWREGKAAAGGEASLFLPMTHQFVAEDKRTAQMLETQHPELAAVTPVILGGHEHTIIVEEEKYTKIVKMGEDAATIGIVDIWWTEKEELRSKLSQLEATSFAEEPAAKDFKERHDQQLKDLMSQPLFNLKEKTSSKLVRRGTSGIASLLLGMVKRGLSHDKDKVEMVLLNAGNIRGRADYEPGPFMVENLYKEHPWENEMAIVKLPGKVLREAILQSRAAGGKEDKPCFLHCDPCSKCSDAHELLEVNGEKLVEDRLYTVAILVHLLNGMDSIEPLVAYVKSSGLQVPQDEACKPTKFVILQLCMREAWRKILDMPSWDSDADGQLEEEELQRHVTKAFVSLDSNGDGFISKEECLSWLHNKDVPLIEMMFNTMDANNDGRVCSDEIRQMAFS